MHSKSVTASSFSLKHNGLMVDCGATSHIIMEIEKFQNFDYTFQPERHAVELADGTRVSGVALRRGNAEVSLVDSGGKRVKLC